MSHNNNRSVEEIYQKKVCKQILELSLCVCLSSHALFYLQTFINTTDTIGACFTKTGHIRRQHRERDSDITRGRCQRTEDGGREDRVCTSIVQDI